MRALKWAAGIIKRAAGKIYCCCDRCPAYDSVIVTISGAATCVTGCLAYGSVQSSQSAGVDPNGATELFLSADSEFATGWALIQPDAYPFDIYNGECEEFVESRSAELRWFVTCFKDDAEKPLGLFLVAVDTVPPIEVGVAALYDIGNGLGPYADLRFDFGEEVALPGPCGGTLVVTPG